MDDKELEIDSYGLSKRLTKYESKMTLGGQKHTEMNKKLIKR